MSIFDWILYYSIVKFVCEVLWWVLLVVLIVLVRHEAANGKRTAKDKAEA